MLREKYVPFALAPRLTQQSIATAVARVSKIHGFQGSLNSKHRLFIMSADLLAEAPDAPWRDEAKVEQATIEGALSYLKGVTNETDFVLAFDGRSRKVRRMIEDDLGSGGVSLGEIWLVYKAGPGRRCGDGASRRMFMASQNKEVGFLKMTGTDCAKVITKERKSFSAAGEASTHYSTFTNVPLHPIDGASKISMADKKTIKLFSGQGQDNAPMKPPKWQHSAVPLFWCETKSEELWQELLQAHNAGAVVDVTPGSGVLAAACLALGIEYLGIATCSVHQQWLCNNADRMSCQQIVKSGSPIYHQETSELINKYFSDVLEDLAAEEKCKLYDDDDDESDGAAS